MRASLLAVALAFATLAAQAQLTNTNSGFAAPAASGRGQLIYTNLIATQTTNAANLSTNVYPVFKDRGLGLWLGTQTSNTSVAYSNTLWIDTTPDLFIWSSNSVAVTWFPPTNTAGAVQWFFTNVLRDRFDNAKYWRWGYVQPGACSTTNHLAAFVFP